MCSGLSINDLSALTNGKMDHTFYSTIRGTELVLQQQQKRKRKNTTTSGTSCHHNRALNRLLSDSTTILRTKAGWRCERSSSRPQSPSVQRTGKFSSY